MRIEISRPYVFVATFAVAVSGGALATFAGLPLSWLIGSLLAVAGVNLLAGRFPAPSWFRQVGQATAGVSVGLAFTPSLAERLVDLSGYMIATALLSIAFGALLSMVLARLTKVDGTTAYFASLPGGVAEMSVLAERFGGDTALVALSQSLRVVIVVLTIPTAAAIFDWQGHDNFAGNATPFQPWILAVMLGAGWVVAWLLGRAHVTNNWLLGGLLTGAGIAYLGLPASRVPPVVIDLSQILIGCALGSRFSRETVIKLKRFLPATIATTLVLIGLTSLLALGMAWLGKLDVATLVIASAPGGVAEMSLTARTLHVGSAEVTAFHLVRILLVILLSAPIFRLAIWLKALRLQRLGSGS